MGALRNRVENRLKVIGTEYEGTFDEGEVIKVENCRRKWREDGGEEGGRIRAYRRYCKEDVEDIGTSTKVETAERHGGDGLECTDDIVKKTFRRISRRIQGEDD